MSKRVCGYAKSNRSACKKCKGKLDKGVLRVGVVTMKDEVEMTSWYHPGCAPKPKNPLEPGDYEGYADLEDADKEAIDEVCAGGAPKAKKPRLAGDTIPTDDPNSSESGFAEAWALYANMPIPTLKEFLDANVQAKTGTKAELVAACVDGHLHGALPVCPMCEKGRLKRAEDDASSFGCKGYFDDTVKVWMQCGYKTTADLLQSQRHPWREPAQGKRADGAAEAEAEGEAKGGAKGAGKAAIDPAEFEGLDRRAMAARLVELARAEELSLAQDESSALIAAGTALGASMDDDGNPVPAKAFEELRAKFPRKVQKELKCRHEKNATICTLLKEYADLVTELEDNKYAASSTRKSVSALMNLDYEITEGKKLIAKATKVEGIGKSTAEKIDEILATGTFAKLEELRSKATQR
eukprot:CAMPEP_0119418514 /NCGR_PEP_ID=MMETSP1335-20130426/18418_1 /TAXON_ID=259385 /ORGANISM="Chrysoculter rhomboideus, Strain RCC1486" /LENGTH=409 /DNA_ID=CAMNT_0007443767 /DNA_START=78 /DNA_END=1307 /DNA_ORIENTATION=-